MTKCCCYVGLGNIWCPLGSNLEISSCSWPGDSTQWTCILGKLGRVQLTNTNNEHASYMFTVNYIHSSPEVSSTYKIITRAVPDFLVLLARHKIIQKMCSCLLNKQQAYKVYSFYKLKLMFRIFPSHTNKTRKSGTTLVIILYVFYTSENINL